MNKKCFLVVSPEGSGNYMIAEALVEAGCEYVNEEENLREVLSKCQSDKVVIIRSLPHRGKFPDIMAVCDDIWWASYDIVLVVMVREPNATIRSVQRRMPQETSKVKYNMKVAWQHIGILANHFPVRPIPYEALVHSKQFREWLFGEWGLKCPGYHFKDENKKYYG